MFDIRMMFVMALCACVVVCAVIFFVSMHRRRMASLVREAMNTTYQVVEFHKINLIPKRCDGETLLRFAAACAMFRDAETSLCAGRYKRTIELAKQATATIRSLRGRLVCQEHARPVGPSCRIISNGGLLWMGN
jgi:hypothetical protein